MIATDVSLLERKRHVLMPSLYHFYGDNPLHLVKGKGAHVWDREGRRYLDFYAGVAVNSLGHCHPEVVDAVSEQLHTLQHTTTIYLTEPMIALAEDLVEVSPPELTRVFFCADGSGANEGAMIAARIATGRPDFIALERSLHGRTSLTMAATGIEMWKNDPFTPSCVHRISAPVNDDLDYYLDELRSVIVAASPNSIAAFIAEPVLGNGGIIVPPLGYFREVKKLLDEFGILMIADEVQTGFCRTGAWFGISHEEISPDLMSVAKALGNGFPVAAWLANDKVAVMNKRPAASTFGGNLPAMAAGLKVIEIMKRDHLDLQADILGILFLSKLSKLKSEYENIVDIRGRGLMIGVELRSSQQCDKVLEGLCLRGVLAGKTGVERNVLTFQPPLIVTPAQIDEVCDALEMALRECESTHAD